MVRDVPVRDISLSMDPSSRGAYIKRIEDLHTELEETSRQVSEEYSKRDKAISEQGAIQKDISSKKEILKKLNEDIVASEKKMKMLSDSEVALAESHTKNEADSAKRVSDLNDEATRKMKEIADLDAKKKERDSVISDRDAALKDKITAQAEESQIRSEAQNVLSQAQLQAQEVTRREAEAEAIKTAAGVQSTQNARDMAVIEKHAAIIQKHYRSIGAKNDDGSWVDVYKELGILKDKL